MDDSRYVTNSLNLMLSVMDKIGQIMAAHAMQQQAPGENAEINSAMNSLGNMKDIVVSSEIAGKATEEAFGQVDIAGYNYGTCRYVQDGKTYPDRIIVGSETYATELDVNWELVEKYPYLIGDFTWTAWDYLGEAGIGKVEYGEGQQPGFYAPYPCKAAYCGRSEPDRRQKTGVLLASDDLGTPPGALPGCAPADAPWTESDYDRMDPLRRHSQLELERTGG